MRTRPLAFLRRLACAACLAGGASLARAAPPPPSDAPSMVLPRLAQCDGLDQAFPRPDHRAASGGNAFRPLPTLKPAGNPAAPRTLGLDLTLQRPGGAAGAIQVGDYLVQDVPAFVAALRNGTAVADLEGPGGPVHFPAACLADPRWIYGGTHWALQQGDTISEHLRSALHDAAGSVPATPSARLNPPANGGVPCRATNTHTHGLLVSPYHPTRPGAGPYGDYVLDATVPPGTPLDADTCAPVPAQGTAAAPVHAAHGTTEAVLDYEIRIPGHPGMNSLATGEHPSGLMWFHPHPHGYSRPQVEGGTTSVITVGALADYACPLNLFQNGKCPSAVSALLKPERILELRDAQIGKGADGAWHFNADYRAGLCGDGAQVLAGECTAADKSAKWVFTVNGIQFPQIGAQPGAAEIWRIANTSPNVTYDLAVRAGQGLGGAQTAFQVLAIDGVSIAQAGGAFAPEHLLMMPGSRAEIRLPPPHSPGTYTLVSLGAATGAGPNGDAWPAAELAAVTWPAPPVPRPGASPQVLTQRSEAAAGAAPLGVAGPDGGPGLAGQPSPELRRIQPPGPALPAGCTYAPGDTRRVYMVHRTVPVDPSKPQEAQKEVFGLVAGIQRAGGALEFFDKDWNVLTKPQGSGQAAMTLDEVWAAGTAADPAFPAFGHGTAGDVCSVRGSSERWVVENWTSEDHNFHLHQSRFLIDQAHAKDAAFFQFPQPGAQGSAATDEAIRAMVSDLLPFEQGGWINSRHDSVPVPRGDGGPCLGDPIAGAGCPRPGRVTILVGFDRAEQVGDFVYHCHILEHEDGGMMARVQVRCPPGVLGCPAQGGATAMAHQH